LALIRDHHRRGESLRREDVMRQHPDLERAAAMHYPTWREAVEAAGFRARGYQRWDAKRVLREIRSLHRQGGELAHTRAPSQLVEAAITYFGSWRQAIEGAGLDYDSIRLPSRDRTSPDAILAMLREAAKSGRTGVGDSGFIPAAIADLARKRFGSVWDAVAAAGLDPAALVPAAHVPYHDDEVMAAELRRLVRAEPDMTLTAFNKTRVCRAIRRHYASVAEALSALGISGWPQQRNFPLPSPEEVVAGIQARRRRGDPMTTTALNATERRLAKAAYRHFGTWRAAMRAAGFGAEVAEGRWSRAQVCAELNGWRLRREPLDGRTIQRDDPALWEAIVKHYGSLAAALREADEARPATSCGAPDDDRDEDTP
jgi:hypothetical protein